MEKLILFAVRFKYFLTIFISTILINLVVVAQDSTGTGGGTGEFELSPNVVMVLSIILGIYEIIARLIPTVNNYSIIGWIIKIIQTILPNKAKPEAIQQAKKSVIEEKKGAPPPLP